MFAHTFSKESDGGVFNVYRDHEHGRTVTHYSARRGGCLYLGEVTMFRTGPNGDDPFSFTTTSGPWGEHGPSTAASYWRKHFRENVEQPEHLALAV